MAVQASGLAVDTHTIDKRTRLTWLASCAFAAGLLLLPLILRLDGKPHADWQQFLGRFHPLIVHLPIGILVVLPLLELAGFFRPALREAAHFLLSLALFASFGAVILGALLAHGSGDAGAVVTRHMWGGIALTICVLLCVLVRPHWAAGSLPWSYPALLFGVMLLLSWTAHQGGSLTHGENYLFEFLPSPLKRLTGAGKVHEKTASSTSFYAQQIDPVLDAKCVSCHGGGNVKGGLRVDSYDLLMKGGKDGAVIVAGHPEKSLLLERVLLPTTHEKFMPAEGKPPLKPEEIALIQAWIAQGASSAALTVAGVSIREQEKPLPQVADYSSRLDEISQQARSMHVTLTPVSRNFRDGLILNAVDGAASFGDAQLASLAPLAPYIVEVELARTTVTDACFTTLATFPHLRAIHLEGTAVRGTGLYKLSHSSELTYVNLSNTQVTAAAVAPLSASKTIAHLYLYNTPAQPVVPAIPEKTL